MEGKRGSDLTHSLPMKVSSETIEALGGFRVVVFRALWGLGFRGCLGLCWV